MKRSRFSFYVRRPGLRIAVLLVLAAVALARADSGNEVVVIYNSRLSESLAVANYYASRRHVPTNQVFGFPLSTGEEMSRAEFQTSLQRPLATALENQKLWHISSRVIPATTNRPGRVEWKVQRSKIRYAVLCYGIPVRIASDPESREPETENLSPTLRRNEAAVDSELALLPAIEQNLPLNGPLNNPLYASTNPAAFHPTNNVLMVTRLDGPSAAIARGLVDKAITAETEGLWGRAYFDLRGLSNSVYKSGDDTLRGAAQICRTLGFDTVVDNNPETFPPEFPMSQIAIYCGWYDGAVSGPFTRANVEFMPGAFAYHLHSFSAANLRSANENWAGPLLARGATATIGFVYEPYLQFTPDMGIFLSRLIFGGMTYGEAAYAAQAVLSWQTTVVGDPLYRPFGRTAGELHRELERAHSPRLEWSCLRLANLNLARGVLPAAVADYLEQVPLVRQSAVLTEKLAGLYVEIGKPHSAVDAFAQALKLKPSPQQRVRLRLRLQEELLKLNRQPDAFRNLKAFLGENPDYPDKLSIYRALAGLAKELGKSAEAADYQQEIERLAPPPAPETNR